ncbi:DNA-processing protein DprA [Sphingobacterium wenxiniae]|uniref:DNA processing protein n=1 Tax=Sphingobacterium wenxiniae TaxID=683125 RepID=A0A1I6TYG3_9SPHI|nr:DNA-processing protein DprA [Sphingobacterium wenxiniae]SFS94283.1 DNA processing protein [Sphingobacterium wenxiniae]
MSRLQQIALTKVKGIGPKTARTLLAHFGCVEEIFHAGKKELAQIPYVGQQIIHTLQAKEHIKEAEKELAFVEKHNIDVLWIEDKAYPKRLKACEDAPILLYYKGGVPLNPPRCVSIVGTRNATSYGKGLTEELITGLKGLDVHVVSGLAYGIDVHAHRQALKHNIPTIGVMGHGLDLIYPAAHRDVASRMLEDGGILTEFPSGTKPDRMNFPARNRIIAGMADVTIVVEAARKGGALITAEIANSYNRDVCAFPGRTDQEYSEGCNYLIKTNRAHLIRNAEDLLYLMGWEQKLTPEQGKQLSLLTVALSRDEQAVYDYLKEKEEALVDDIAIHLDWPTSKLALILLEMEMNGILISLPGKKYKNL